MSTTPKNISWNISKYSIILLLYFSFLAVSGQEVYSDIDRLQHIRAITYEKGQSFKHWVNSIILDDDGLMWVSSHNILYTFDGQCITERAAIEDERNIFFNRIFKIKDTFYLQNYTSELYYYPINSNEKYIKKSSWNYSIVNHHITKSKKELISTVDGMILEYKDGKFDTLFQAPILKSDEFFNASQGSLISDHEDEDYIWYYFKNNLFHLNLSTGNLNKYHTLKEGNIDLNYGEPHGCYSVGLTQKGDYLFLGSTQKGLIRFHIPTKSWKSYSKDIPSQFIGKESHINSVISISSINDSLLLLGGTFAPFFNINQEQYYEHLGSDREHRLIKHGTVIKKGDIFFLNNYNGGVSILSPKNNLFNNFHNYEESEFYSKVIDSNSLAWTSDKLKIYATNTSGDTLKIVNAFKLFGEEVSKSLLVDDNQNIWLGTTSGIIRYNIEKGTYRKFTEFDGLPGKDWMTNFTAKINEHGIALVKTKNLSSTFALSTLNTKNEISQPFINQVKVLDEINLGLTNNELILNPEEDFFTIQYSSLNYVAHPLDQYEYKLEGYDENWMKGNRERNVAYNYLPPGSYNFKVRLTNQEGTHSKVSDDFKIYLKAHWFETILFKVAVLLLLSGIAIAFYQIKTTALKRELELRSNFNEELSQVKLEALRSQMNPHFLFNCLNSIDNFILSNDSKNASEYLGKFSKLIRNILDYSTTNAITLSQEIETTEIYLKMEQMRYSEKFDYEIKINPGIDKTIKNIPPLILQPYVENSIWHGLLHKEEKGTIKIIIDYDDDNYIIEIDDDGIGRAKALGIKTKSATKRKSHGMKITEDRIRLINRLNGQGGTVETIDKLDSYGNPLGTKVILKLPIRSN